MFITFEGIDFSGKTTQVELLKKFLTRRGNTVKIIREPGGTTISEKVRDILLDKKHSKMFIETEIFLFSSARAQLVREKIRPYLEKGFYVISDRFHDSTTAYQGFGRGIPLEVVNHVNQLAIGETVPDITFYIDVPVHLAEERKSNKIRNSGLDRIEISDMNFYERVRAGYKYLTDNEERFRLIDGTQSINKIHELIVYEIELLGKRSLNEKI
jgi:dTMP kinase